MRGFWITALEKSVIDELNPANANLKVARRKHFCFNSRKITENQAKCFYLSLDLDFSKVVIQKPLIKIFPNYLALNDQNMTDALD